MIHSWPQLLVLLNLFVIIILYYVAERRSQYIGNIVSYQNSFHAQRFIFRKELIRQFLASHSRFYGYSADACNVTNGVNREQPRILFNVSELLAKLPQQVVPFPEAIFEGQGIVFIVGYAQASIEKVSLKMIELSGTKLPVQDQYLVKHLPS
ncbi:unnamed protein product [Rotaria socialis]|uniref:Uncharacterized protein n=1 Tax=Rotaria socialis TaxID=392032 RepID=A0A820LAU5_9BILA|nr:unnamed protein product [Rotaria socialis]CAF4661186.1 unnamed protein product [Rotaria socialis]